MSEMFWNNLVQAASKNVIGIYPPKNQRLTGRVLTSVICLGIRIAKANILK